MAQTRATTDLTEPMLLKLFQQHLRSRLVEKLKPIANEVMREAIEEAMGDLDTTIRAQYVDYGSKLVMRLAIDGVEKELT